MAENRHFFISYSTANFDEVEQLTADLREQGVAVWIDQVGLKPGTPDWEQAIRDAIHNAQAVIYVASPDARRSAYVRGELAISQMEKRPVFPVWIEGDFWMDSVPMWLTSAQFIDLRGDAYQRGLSQLVDALAGKSVKLDEEDFVPVVEKVIAPKEVNEEHPPRNPYKGLRAFRVQDRIDFFGRGEFVRELVSALGDGSQPPRFLCVIGPSGSGKSSVMMAGLLPELQDEAINGSSEWVYTEPFTPGSHPVENLAAALAQRMPEKSMRAIRDDLSDPTTRGLHLLAKQLLHHPEQRLVLYIDQFEELFTLTQSHDERQQFINALTTAVEESDGQVIVLCSLRGDFYDRPLQYPQLCLLMEAYHKAIPPLTVADLHEIVRGPANLPDVRVAFEEGLETDLVFAVREQLGALPLLQFTLDQLFERRENHTLTRTAYEAMGKVRGALARHAEDTYEHLPSDAHRELARALFLRLIEPGATEQDTTRRRATSNELKLPDAEQTQLLRETADIFVSARLLITAQAIRSTDTLTEEKQPSTQQHTSGSTIEVSHEALIREWDRLGGWLRDARDDISLQMGVANEASEWLRRDRPDDMLYRGTVLEGAEAWMERSTASVDEVLFITESRRAEEDRIAERRATRRRMRLLAQAAIILLVITVISLSVTVFAVSQQATEAQQQQLTLEVQATTALGAQSQAEEAQAGAEAAQQTLEVAQATAVEQAALSGTQVSHANATLTLIPATLDAAEAEVAAAESARAAAQNDGYRFQVAGQAFLNQGNENDALAFVFEAIGEDNPPIEVQQLFYEIIGDSRNRQTLSGHTDNVVSVAFSPDGQTLASASADGTVRLWDVVSGSDVATLDDYRGGIRDVAFSPDGQFLATAGADGTVRLWDVTNGSFVATLGGHTNGAWNVAFSPDGRILVSTSCGQPSDDTEGFCEAGAIRRWDLSTGSELPPFVGYVFEPIYLVFSPVSLEINDLRYDPGQVMASVGCGVALRPTRACIGGQITLWDMNAGEEIANINAHADTIMGAAFSTATLNIDGATYSPGQILVSGSADGTIRVWNLDNSREVATLAAHSSSVNKVAFNPAAVEINGVSYGPGQILVSASSDRTVRLWEMSSGSELATLSGHSAEVSDVAFSTDGQTLASASFDDTVRLWDVSTIVEPNILSGHTSSIYGMAFSPNGQLLASVGNDHTIRLWDVANGSEVATLAGHSGAIYGVTFSADGQTLASASLDSTIRLWDIASGMLLTTLRKEGSGFLALDFNPALLEISGTVYSPGQILAVAGCEIPSDSQGCLQGEIKLWDVARSREVATFSGRSGWVTGLSFSTEAVGINGVSYEPGQILVSSGQDNTIRAWEVSTGTALLTLDEHEDWVWNVVFSPDGQILASASYDDTLRLWGVSAGDELMTLTGHTDAVYGVAFSPDGQVLASAGEDRTVRLWDVGMGVELMALTGHTDTVVGVAFSPDGQILASASHDGTIRLWNVTTLPVLRAWAQENRYIREFNCEERESYDMPVGCESGIFPTRTPFPLPAPPMLPSWTPFWTPQPTLTSTPLPETIAMNLPTGTPTPTSEPARDSIVGQNRGEIEVGWYERWFYQGHVGEVLTIGTVAEWDTVLILYDATGNEIARNDDDGPGLNALIEITLPEDGQYTIEVRGYLDQSGGAYSLVIDSNFAEVITLTPTITPTTSPPHEGAVGENRGTTEVGWYERWLYQGQAGEALTIWTVAEWDTVLQVFNANVIEIAYNDDALPNNNSLIEITLPEGGQYAILVRSYRDRSGGEYSLFIESSLFDPIRPTPTPGPTATEGPSPTMTPTLAPPRDGIVGENRGEIEVGGYQRWFYEGQATEELVITTNASWDTVLYLYDVNGLEIARNDDDGPGLNSRIAITLPEDGRYTIEVRSYQDQYGGVYTLTIESSLVEPTTPTPTITPTTSPPREGAVGENHGEIVIGWYDRWLYAGQANEQLVIWTVAEWDTVLYLYDSGENEVAFNDDALPSNNALIEVTLPEDGQYAIEVRGYTDRHGGEYRLFIGSSLVNPIRPTSTPTATSTPTPRPPIPAAVGENHGETAVGSGERWFYEGQASEELVITTGSDWDTLLYLYDVNALEIARDDDGGPNLNSQIRFILPEDGRYVIEVRGYQDQHGGVYTLTIESSLVEPTTATPTPTPNATP